MSHHAIISKIDRIEEIPGATNICSAYVLGTQIVVSKDQKINDVGILFPSELQLSEDYCRLNNLYRHSELNDNKSKTGFFDDNRRVRAQPFLKVKSDGYFAPLSSVSYTGYDISKFKVGDMFSELEGKLICEKYISKKTRESMGRQSQQKKIKVIETPFFSKHPDTDNIKYYIDAIPIGALISFQAKTHGTSGRYSLSKTYRELPKWKKLINKIYPIFNNEKWEYLVGTRNCVLFEENADKQGFHGSEQFRFDVLEKLKPYLSKGLNVYCELYGYANGNPIMPAHDVTKLKDKAFQKKYGKNIIYKYGSLEGECNFKIYRISLTTEDNISIDFTQSQLQNWCQPRGLNYAKNLIPPFIYDGDKEKLMKIVDELTERPEVLSEDYVDSSHISEGIVIRLDDTTLIPKFFKKKSWAFSVCEGFAKEDNIDIEDAA